jgi:putative heme-binding domain-containing protein
LLNRAPKGKIKTLVNPHGASADLDARARSYLHANCSHCHRENAGGSVPSVMNFELTLEKTRMLKARPVLGDLGLDGGKVIAPGEPFSSVLLFRASATGRSRMPYLSSEWVDEAGIALLRDWIASLGEGSVPELKTAPRSSSEALRLAHALPSFPPEGREVIAREAALSSNPLFRDLFDRFLAAEDQTTLQQAVLSKNQILALRGNANRGERLLSDASRLSCVQCHSFGTGGRLIGPDLKTATRGKSRAQILESILEPSKEIAPEYVLHLAELDDDETVSGIVIKRTDAEVVLRDAAAAEHTYPAAKIKSLRALQLSAMPEGLLSGLNAQEAADLLEALLPE